jgi:hypothetical protein
LKILGFIVLAALSVQPAYAGVNPDFSVKLDSSWKMMINESDLTTFINVDAELQIPQYVSVHSFDVNSEEAQFFSELYLHQMTVQKIRSSSIKEFAFTNFQINKITKNNHQKMGSVISVSSRLNIDDFLVMQNLEQVFVHKGKLFAITYSTISSKNLDLKKINELLSQIEPVFKTAKMFPFLQAPFYALMGLNQQAVAANAPELAGSTPAGAPASTAAKPANGEKTIEQILEETSYQSFRLTGRKGKNGKELAKVCQGEKGSVQGIERQKIDYKELVNSIQSKNCISERSDRILLGFSSWYGWSKKVGNQWLLDPKNNQKFADKIKALSISSDIHALDALFSTLARGNFTGTSGLTRSGDAIDTSDAETANKIQEALIQKAAYKTVDFNFIHQHIGFIANGSEVQSVFKEASAGRSMNQSPVDPKRKLDPTLSPQSLMGSNKELRKEQATSLENKELQRKIEKLRADINHNAILAFVSKTEREAKAYFCFDTNKKADLVCDLIKDKDLDDVTFMKMINGMRITKEESDQLKVVYGGVIQKFYGNPNYPVSGGASAPNATPAATPASAPAGAAAGSSAASGGLNGGSTTGSAIGTPSSGSSRSATRSLADFNAGGKLTNASPITSTRDSSTSSLSAPITSDSSKGNSRNSNNSRNPTVANGSGSLPQPGRPQAGSSSGQASGTNSVFGFSASAGSKGTTKSRRGRSSATAANGQGSSTDQTNPERTLASTGAPKLNVSLAKVTIAQKTSVLVTKPEDNSQILSLEKRIFAMLDENSEKLAQDDVNAKLDNCISRAQAENGSSKLSALQCFNNDIRRALNPTAVVPATTSSSESDSSQ